MVRPPSIREFPSKSHHTGWARYWMMAVTRKFVAAFIQVFAYWLIRSGVNASILPEDGAVGLGAPCTSPRAVAAHPEHGRHAQGPLASKIR
jgi:hypothetical protein